MRREPKLFGGERPPPEQGAPPAPESAPESAQEPAPAPEAPAQEAMAGVAPATGGAPSWRRIARIAVWAAAAVAVVAAVWGGYSLLGGEGAPQDIPFFTAEEGPFKVRPEEPGGTQIPNQDMLVLEGSISGQREEGLEVLLPRPEEPLPLDSAGTVDVADTADTAAAGGQAVPDFAGEGEAGEGEEVVDVAAPAVNEVDEAAEGQALFTPEQVDALVEAAVPGEGEIPLLAVPVPGFKPAQASASGATAAAPTVTTDDGESGSLSLDDIASAIGIDDGTGGAAAPAPDGVVRVQIASYSSGGDAEAAWQRLQRRHPDLLAEMEARIAETAIGNATYWRLQVGAFSRRSDASRFCDELKKRDVDCLVVAP